MTIAEAQKRWHVSDNVLFNYLKRGLIPNITVVDDIINIPEINKPIGIPSNIKHTAENIFIYIFKACNEGYYINSNLMYCMNVSESEFSSCIHELLEKNILRKTSDYIDDTSNIGLRLSFDGINYFNQCRTKRNYEKVLKFLDLGLTVISQIVKIQ